MSTPALSVAPSAAHRLERGSCTRCGLYIRGKGAWCPPGFWMTKEQGEAWSAMNEKERWKYECSLALHRVGDATPPISEGKP